MPNKVLAIIPARGGSKGIPRKNLKNLAGKPLISWTIEAAQKANSISRVIVSSDDEEITRFAQGIGCDVPFMRPSWLAEDDTPSIDVVLHAIGLLPGYDFVVLLQPTSPLRTSRDIDAAYQMLIQQKASSCVSVCPAKESPYWMYRISNDRKTIEPFVYEEVPKRRQDLPDAYILNGAIYISSVSLLVAERSFIRKDTVGYVMSRKRSIDIDTEKDFQLANSSMLLLE